MPYNWLIGGTMGTTQPIRKKEELRIFMNYYKDVQPHPRNHTLIVLGLHTALRISDILLLKWKDVYDFQKRDFQKHLFVQEKKTGKHTVIALNSQVKYALTTFMNTRCIAPGDYIFTKNTDYHKPLNRSQAYRIIRHAAEESVHLEHISCHSLRKSFGYHAWKQGTPPALLMDIYNHSSYQITKKYLGIEQDERDDLFLKLEI